MKRIKTYLMESKNFKLNDSERETLASVIGVLCGDMGDDEIDEKCADLIKELTDKEKEQLSDLFNVLDDPYNFRSINRSTIINDIPLIKRIIEWMDDNDAWVAHDDYELINILDKIS